MCGAVVILQSTHKLMFLHIDNIYFLHFQFMCCITIISDLQLRPSDNRQGLEGFENGKKKYKET